MEFIPVKIPRGVVVTTGHAGLERRISNAVREALTTDVLEELKREGVATLEIDVVDDRRYSVRIRPFEKGVRVIRMTPLPTDEEEA